MTADSFPEPTNIALLRLSAVGDVCHTVPVLRALQDRWPNCRLTWVIGHSEAGLVGDIPGVEFIRFDKSDGLDAYRNVRHHVRGKRFDALLHMQIALRSSWASLLIPADRKIGFDRQRARDWQWLFTHERIPAHPRQHVMDSLLEFARVMDADISRPRWDIPVPEAARSFAAEYIPSGSRTLIISPCSSQRARNFRNWRPERYAAVIDHAAQEHGLRTLITGGPSEREREMAHQIGEQCQHTPVNLVGQTSLKQLFALIQHAETVICPDSGPAHMATAAGTPVIGLYASSNPERTGPYFSREWCVNRYPEALRAQTGKDVEKVRWGARIRDPEVMDRIQVEDVTERLDALMANSQKS